MFKLAIEVCFENHFGLIHVIFLSLWSTKSGYFFLGHPVHILWRILLVNFVVFALMQGFDLKFDTPHLSISTLLFLK